MGKTCKIARKSIFSFLQNYQYFTSTPSLLALPFAFSTLLSQSLVSSSPVFPLVHERLRSLFLASGLPPWSEIFVVLNLKLSQTILAFLFLSPFTLSSLLLSKVSVIKAVSGPHQSSQPSFSLFKHLLVTQLCNTLAMLAASSTSFSLVAILFNFFAFLGLSSPGALFLVWTAGAILYSVILANTYVICNLALVSSGIEMDGGFTSILKACLMIKGRTLTALSLAVPINMALAATEALFSYRIVRAYNRAMAIDSAMVLEGVLIAYLYCMVLVLDTIIGCMFWRSCQKNYCSNKMDLQDRDCKIRTKIIALEIPIHF